MALVNKNFSDIITFTRASTATYFDSAGVLTSAATNAPRFDYNPSTLAAQGLLIEESRTNLLTRSEEFNDAAWTKTNSSITANAATSPSGTVTADKLIEALDVNLVHQTTQSSVTIVSLGAYTASCYVKADTRTRVRIGFLVAGTSGVTADANLTAGTITAASAFGGGSAVGSSIQAINNGWYRITVSGTGAAGTSGECRLELLDASGNRQYNGDGTSGLFIWGAQLEAGAFPTSYIPTTTTALTRAADVASVNTLSPWFNASTGTLFTESQQLPGQTAAVFPRIAVIDDGSTNNSILNLWRSDTSRLYGAVRVGAVDQADVGTTGVTQTNVNKIGFAYATNDFAASVNGGAPSTDTLGAVPSGLTTLRIGRSSGTDFLNGYLRRITYYPRRLSNAELQAITA
jgi:hypothetical protein